MLQSMTGFGKSEVVFGNKNYIISLKSVNSKSADINIKLPSAYRDKENEVRTFLVSELQRGKIDLFISTDTGMDDSNEGVSINEGLLKTYLAKFMKVSEGLNVSDDTLFTLSSRMPNVFTQERQEIDENEWKQLMLGINDASNQLMDFRKQEGGVLEKDLSLRINRILSLAEDIKPFEQERIDTVKARLEKQLEQNISADSINRDRFEQELIYYFEKFDITEEKVRLNAHCNLFLETMKEDESRGKKLAFIAQEIGREINTIGSKANHASIQKLVVEMKDELEKIKEQLFNIL